MPAVVPALRPSTSLDTTASAASSTGISGTLESSPPSRSCVSSASNWASTRTPVPNAYASSLFSDDELRKLYDIAYPNKTAGDFWDAGQTNFGVFADATSAAAFQVAVWNIVFDSDLDLSAGSFKWTGGSTAVSTAAQSLLTQVANYSGDGYANWTLYRFVSPIPNNEQRTGYQNYVSATYKVPEPGTLAMLGLALVGLGGAAARRRRD